MDGCATPSRPAWSAKSAGPIWAAVLAALLWPLGAERALAQAASASVEAPLVHLHCSMGDDGAANCKEGISASNIDGWRPQAQFAPQPQYPLNLLNEETEGWVLVRFTISKEGTVLDPVVIRSQPPDTPFDGAALRTVGRYRFEPTVVDGQAVAVHDVAVRMAFSIDDN